MSDAGASVHFRRLSKPLSCLIISSIHHLPTVHTYGALIGFQINDFRFLISDFVARINSSIYLSSLIPYLSFLIPHLPTVRTYGAQRYFSIVWLPTGRTFGAYLSLIPYLLSLIPYLLSFIPQLIISSFHQFITPHFNITTFNPYFLRRRDATPCRFYLRFSTL